MIKMPKIDSVIEVTTRYQTNTFFADKIRFLALDICRFL